MHGEKMQKFVFFTVLAVYLVVMVNAKKPIWANDVRHGPCVTGNGSKSAIDALYR